MSKTNEINNLIILNIEHEISAWYNPKYSKICPICRVQLVRLESVITDMVYKYEDFREKELNEQVEIIQNLWENPYVMILCCNCTPDINGRGISDTQDIVKVVQKNIRLLKKAERLRKKFNFQYQIQITQNTNYQKM